MKIRILNFLVLISAGLNVCGQNYLAKLGTPQTDEYINSFVFADEDHIIYCGKLYNWAAGQHRYLYGKFNIRTKTHVWAHSISWLGTTDNLNNSNTKDYIKIVKLSSGDFMLLASFSVGVCPSSNNKSLFTKIDNLGNVIYHKELSNTRCRDFDEGNLSKIIGLCEECNASTYDIISFDHSFSSAPISSVSYSRHFFPFNININGYYVPMKVICEKGQNSNAFYIASNLYSVHPWWNSEKISLMKYSNQNVLNSFSYQSVVSLPVINASYRNMFCNSFTLENNIAQISYLYNTGNQYEYKLGLAKFDISNGSVMSNRLSDKVLSGNFENPLRYATRPFYYPTAHENNVLIRTSTHGESQSKFNVLETQDFSLNTSYKVHNYIDQNLQTRESKIWHNQSNLNVFGAGIKPGNSSAFGDIFIFNKPIISSFDCTLNENTNLPSTSGNFEFKEVNIPGSRIINFINPDLNRISHDFIVEDLVCIPCAAGANPPNLSNTILKNICPLKYANFTTINASNLPSGAALSWHTGTPATLANKFSYPLFSSGVIYAAFYDANVGCFSPTTQVTVIIEKCCKSLKNIQSQDITYPNPE
jgi:hypothetical protein